MNPTRSIIAITVAIGVCIAVVQTATAADPARAKTYIEDARKLIARGDIRAAVIQLRNAVQNDPQSGEARFELAKGLLAMSDVEAAETEARRAADNKYDVNAVEALLGEILLKAGNYGRLLEEIPAGDRPPELEASVRVSRGYAFFNLQRVRDAERSFKSALDLSTKKALARAGLAQVRVYNEDLRGGVDLLEEAVAEDPRLVGAWLLLARVRDALREPDKALKAYEKVIALTPSDETARLGRATLVLDSDPPTAAADIAAALEVNPASQRGNLFDAILKARQQKWGEAEVALQSIPKMETIPAAFVVLARIKLIQNQLGQADDAISRYLLQNPTEPNALAIKATIVVKRESAARAVEATKAAVAADPENRVMLALLADALVRNGQQLEAAEILNRLSKLAPNDAKSRSELAAQKMRSGQFAEALADLEIARASAPLDDKGRTLLVEVYLRAGKLDEARTAAESFLRDAPSNPAASTLLGMVELRRTGPAAARVHFMQALQVAPDNATIEGNIANTYILENRPGDARAIYEGMLRRSANNSIALIALADLDFAERKPLDAIARLEKARAASPSALSPRMRLVRAYIETGDSGKAVIVAREVERLAPKDPQALASLGAAQVANKEYQTAIQTFRRVVDLSGEAPAAYLDLSRAMEAASDFIGARAAIQRAIEIDLDNADHRNTLVAFSRKREMLTQSIVFARDLIERRPQEVAAYDLLGALLEADGQSAEAVKVYTSTLDQLKRRLESGGVESSIDTTRVSRLTAGLARSLARTGRAGIAISNLREHTLTRPDDREVRFLLSGMLTDTKDYKAAIAQLEYLIGTGPVGATLLNNLAWLYQAVGDPRALPTAERAYAAAPDSPAFADTLGWILVQRGEFSRGLEILEKVTSADAPPGQRYRLAFALNKVGRRDDAKRILDAVLGPGTGFEEQGDALRLKAELGG